MTSEDSYFYQDGGKTVGPVTSTDLKSRIKDGKLRLFDLILKEGDAAWRMALEHTDFKEEFRGQSKSAMKEKPWVCLQRKSPDGFDFTTTGPYALEEIREALMAGRVSYTDYVWRSGFNEWKRIGLMEDFNPRLRKAEPIKARPPESAEELMKNVVEMKRAKMPEPEPPPVEAKGGKDLTKEKEKEKSAKDLARMKPEKPDKRSAPPPLPIPPKPVIDPDNEPTVIAARPQTPAPAAPTKKRRRKSVPWVDWGIVAILVVVLGAVALVLSRNIKRQRTLEVPATTVVETVPPTVSSAPIGYDAENEPTPEITEEDEIEPPVKAEPPKVTEEKPDEPLPAKKVSSAPTELILSVQSRNNNQARVDLRTNGSPDFPVYVQVIGMAGQVTSGASFYRYIRLKPTGNPKQPLDLSKVKLPQGKLIFRANTGDLKKEAKLNLGVNDPQFKKNISRVRKLHAFAIWQDRLSLLRVSGLLADRIAAGGKLSTKGLEALNDVRLVNGYKYILFEDWYELKSVYDEARKQPTPALANKAKRIRDKMLSFSVYK